MSEHEIECPCCGDVAASGYACDGDRLACGCAGHITVEEDGEVWANAYEDCGCKDGDRALGGGG